MRQELIQYVELLFAGTPNSEDMKQEILQNTLDRYDDLIIQGKSPEAAYRLAISGIGDINEILGSDSPNPQTTYAQDFRQAIHEEVEDVHHRKMRAVAVAMYILCPTPLFILSEFGLDTMGLCFTLLLIAAATALIIMIRRKDDEATDRKQTPVFTPKQKLRKSIRSAIWAIGLVIYFIVSFLTMAWYITWVIFPIISCVQGLVNAILDLKEAVEYEN